MNKVSDKVSQSNLSGMIIPYNPFTNKPVFLVSEGKFLLPLFSSEEKYELAKDWADFKFARPHFIVDPVDFINSVMASRKEVEYQVILDPYMTEEGKTRFELVVFNGDKDGKS